MKVQVSVSTFGRAPKVSAALGKAQAKGLVAAGSVLQNGVKVALTGGFTSGNFVTGTLVNRVAMRAGDQYGFAQTQRDGNVVVDVGTFGSRKGASAGGMTGYPYAVAWELGHRNTFTRKYERQPRWVPTHKRVAPAMKAEFDKVTKAEFERLAR